MEFELTNEQRKYIGLSHVEDHWEKIVLDNMYLYFDNELNSSSKCNVM